MTVRTESRYVGDLRPRINNNQQARKEAAGESKIVFQSDPPRTLFTFQQFADRQPAFSESSLRWLRFHQDENGFASAFINVGRRVLIDETKFFEVIDGQNSGSSPRGGR